MKPTELERFRTLLTDLRSRLTTEVGHIVSEVAEELRPTGDLSNVPIHNADRAGETLAADLAVVQNEQALIEAVDAALARIAAGTYGVCQNCGLQISAARLEALPHAAVCVACARAGAREPI